MSRSRQLAAILFADISGYNDLMQQDEVNARIIRDKFKNELEKEVAFHNGQIIQFSGDGVLCTFRSSIEAVRAAINVQKRMQESPVVPLRIGIHSGDVMFEEENIYGDGVNIASRIESFAVPGSVFISGKIYDEIKNQKDIEAISLGKFELKNVNVPVEIFGIKGEGLMIPGEETLEGKGAAVTNKKSSVKRILIAAGTVIVVIVLAVFLYQRFGPLRSDHSDLKTLAVLPFTNLSSHQNDEYFTDGMCDEVLTQLSKIGGLNVISRTSTLQFKDTKKSMKEIGNQIGADVLLEGSVQKSDNKVRINVQLIEAKNDQHIWAETYDREMKDVFAIQTDIAIHIASALNTTLTENEETLFKQTPTGNLQAYDFFLRGNKYAESFWLYTRLDEVPEAIRMYEQAIRLDPRFIEAYCALVRIYLEISWQKLVINNEEYMEKSRDWLNKMLALNIDKPIVHATLGYFKYAGERDYSAALAETAVAEKGLPNSVGIINTRACVTRRMGRLDESVKYFIKEAELSPNSGVPRFEVSTTYCLMRDFDNALKYVNEVIKIAPEITNLYVSKAFLYVNLKGDLVQASAILQDAAPMVDTAGFQIIRNYIDMLNGNYQSVINRLKNWPDTIYYFSQTRIIPKDLHMAMLYHFAGDEANAMRFFKKAKDFASAEVAKQPDDFRWHSAYGIAMAGLGEKQKALEEINKERELMGVSKDAIIGMSPLEDMARVHIMFGDEDAAIKILEQLLKMPFGWDMTNTVPLYRIHPYWKPLLNNPRFQKMIQ